MKKFFNALLLIFGLTLIGIQFFPTQKNTSTEIAKNDLLLATPVPSQVATYLENACYDCHSDQTQYPWYHKVQPLAWIIEQDIQEGKHALNFNEFLSYKKAEQARLLSQINQTLKKKSMPPMYYRLLHPEAHLSKSERISIEKWITQALQRYHLETK